MPNEQDGTVIERPYRVPVSATLAGLFSLRWVLGRYGSDPCDEWSVDTVLGLPDGLHYREGQVMFRCRVCEAWAEWPVEPELYEHDAHENVCGVSPRCCP